MNWFYEENGEEVGPLSELALAELHQCGVISDDTPVRPEGSGDWVRFESRTKNAANPSANAPTAEPQCIKFSCPRCDQHIAADDSDAGVAIQCPTCGGEIVIPEASGSDEAGPAIVSGNPPEPAEPPASTSRPAKAGKLQEAGRSVAGTLNQGMNDGWSGIKRRSKQAALKAQIQKLRNIDLRAAYHTLGTACFGSATFGEELQDQHQTIRELDSQIAEKQAKTDPKADETKMGAIKRMGKGAAKAGHARALAVRRESLVTELGKAAYELGRKDCPLQICEAVEVIKEIEAQIETKAAAAAGPAADDAPKPAFSAKTLIPVIVCCLGFGWIIPWILPERYFLNDGFLGSIIPVSLLAIPALTLSILGLITFLRPARLEWPKLVGVAGFTMVLGIAALLGFHAIAEKSLDLDNRYYGKATAFVYAVKLIGWSGQQLASGNLFQSLLGSIIHTGFCEEVTKLMPLLILVCLTRKKDDRPALREFLLLGAFSGIGFGLGEALTFYAPWADVRSIQANVIRWFACVPLHAIYTIVDAAFLWLVIPTFKRATSVGAAASILAVAALAIAVVHGVYNTFQGIHVIIGLVLDGLAIALMAMLVRHCARIETTVLSTSEPEAGVIRLPKWLTRSGSCSPTFGRLYALAAFMLLSSLLIAKRPLQAPAHTFSSYTEAPASSVVDLQQMKLGIEQRFRRFFPSAIYSDIDSQSGDMVGYVSEMIQAGQSMADIYPEYNAELTQWKILHQDMIAYNRLKANTQ